MQRSRANCVSPLIGHNEYLQQQAFHEPVDSSIPLVCWKKTAVLASFVKFCNEACWAFWGSLSPFGPTFAQGRCVQIQPQVRLSFSAQS